MNWLINLKIRLKWSSILVELRELIKKMVVKLDINECLKDSPMFRKKLTKVEGELDTFETIYKKVIKFSEKQ